MIVLLDIKDQKADFILELLGNFSFVKIRKLAESEAKLIQELKEAATI